MTFCYHKALKSYEFKMLLWSYGVTMSKFSIEDFLDKCNQIIQETVGLVTWTKEIFNANP